MIKLKQKLLDLGIFKNNKYLGFYCNLITNNLTTIKETGATQQHHIIPRSYYKLIGLAVDNSKENLVNLKIKDHIKAHWYLMKAANNDIIRGKNAAAIRYMCDQFNIKKIEELDLEEVYKQVAIANSKLMASRRKTGWGTQYKKVICIETGIIYNSIKEAGESVGIWPANISAVLKHIVYTAANYHWAYADDATEIARLQEIVSNDISQHKQMRKVINLDTNEIFNSISQAAKAYNISKQNIWGCCQGRGKTAAGQHWKYIEKADN